MAGRITPNKEFAFTLHDVARLLRTYADQRASEFGITRAQWAVVVRLDRQEGLKQSELAEMLDLQPITLTRLLDRLEESGLIERRADPQDRRAKRLYLTAAARPLLERLSHLGEELMATALAGIDRATIKLMLANLSLAKENLRGAIARRSAAPHPLPSLPRTSAVTRVFRPAMRGRVGGKSVGKNTEKAHV